MFKVEELFKTYNSKILYVKKYLSNTFIKCWWAGILLLLESFYADSTYIWFCCFPFFYLPFMWINTSSDLHAGYNSFHLLVENLDLSSDQKW